MSSAMSDGTVADWSEGKFSDVLRHRRERAKPGDPLLSVTADRGVVPQEESGRRDRSSDNKRAYWRVYPGDIVYNTMRMWQGVSARSPHFGIVSPAYTVCSPQEGIDSRFLAYVLKLPQHIAAFKNHSQGLVSDTWNLKYRRFADLPIRFPSLCEQARIAGILNTADEVIRSTERLIAKLERIKQGLLDDLLNYGIDESGHLRDLDRNPGEFVDSISGRLPRGWSVLSCDEITEPSSPICYGIIQAGSHVPHGVPVLMIRNLADRSFADLHRTDPSIDRLYSRSRVRPGDLLLSIKATIGRVAVVPPRYEGNISRDLARIRPTSKSVPEFLRLLFESTFGQQLLELAVVGTTRAEVSIGVLRRLLLPIPPVPEQRRMVELVEAENESLHACRKNLAKLRAMQSGLMDDLLTGRVRANVEEDVSA
jgi:type I restriction enzyme S subunit